MSDQSTNETSTAPMNSPSSTSSNDVAAEAQPLGSNLDANEAASGVASGVASGDTNKSASAVTSGDASNDVSRDTSQDTNVASAEASAESNADPGASPPVSPSSNPVNEAPGNFEQGVETGDNREELDEYSDSKDALLTMNFNQDGGCLAVGTGTGFRICNVCPYQETFRRYLGTAPGDSCAGDRLAGGGIAQVEMLYRTNLLALTGGGTSPQYPPNKVLIYDDHLQRTIGELSFRQKVLRTKLRRDRIVVVLRDRVYVYNFSDLGLLDKVHTGENPRGLIGISTDNAGVGGASTPEPAGEALGATQRNGMVLACPGVQKGQVRVELYGLRRTTFIDAHESSLGALALSVDGSLLATASEKGTVIRLFDTRGVTISGKAKDSSSFNTSNNVPLSTSVPLKEFRRGVERANITCLAFSLDSAWLACASDHGTVHIFQSQDSRTTDNSAPKNRSSSMTGKAMRLLPRIVTAPKKYWVEGEQSHSQIRGVPYPQACSFVPDRQSTIAVAGLDEYGNGCLLVAEFGGDDNINSSDREARRLGYHRFFKKGGAAAMHPTGRRRTKSKEIKPSDITEEGGAYIDDDQVNNVQNGINDIHFGDENEDEFVAVDLNEKSSSIR